MKFTSGGRSNGYMTGHTKSSRTLNDGFGITSGSKELGAPSGLGPRSPTLYETEVV